MINFFAKILISVFIFFPLLASAIEKKCTSFSAPLTGGFCITQEENSTNPDVLYYFHGLGGNLDYWSKEQYYPAQIRQEWQEKGQDAPTVISVSFGEMWLLAQKNKSSISGLFEAFVFQVMPKIELEIGGVKGRRLLLGESMGGFNSIQLGLKTKLFQKVAALCAPMAALKHNATPADITAFIEKSAAWNYYKNDSPQLVIDSVNKMFLLSHAFFPTELDWLTGDPLSLGAISLPLDAPEFYLTAGMYDKYAIYEANEIFAKNLISRGFKVEWRPHWGGHCSIDIPTLANFLIAR